MGVIEGYSLASIHNKYLLYYTLIIISDIVRYDSIRGAARQKAIKVRTNVYLELEIDVIEYRRIQAISKVEVKLARQLASPKRRKSVEELQREATAARERINRIANEKIAKAKENAATF